MLSLHFPLYCGGSRGPADALCANAEDYLFDVSFSKKNDLARGLPDLGNRDLMPTCPPNMWENIMKLEDMPTKELLALHNRIADKPAGPKTFATRTKLVARIEQIAADKNIDLTSFGQPKKPKATAQRAEPKAEATEKKPAWPWRRLACTRDPDGPCRLPARTGGRHGQRADRGAAATAKSVRWYANDMRKKGAEVPPRQKHHPADMDEEQSVEALSTVRVIKSASSDG